MTIQTRSRTEGVGLLMALALVISIAGPAGAGTRAEAALALTVSQATLVADPAATTEVEAPLVQTSRSSNFRARSQATSLTVPRTSAQDLTVTTPGVENDVTIGLPSDRSAAGTLVNGSTVVFPDAANDTDVTVDSLKDGVRVSAVLQSEDAPTKLDFDVDLPAGTYLQAQPDGSIAAIKTDATEEFLVEGQIGTFEAPWAVDADGEAVPTYYEITDTGVRQVVQTDADTAFPVVADPRYVNYLVYIRIDFRKSETKTAANVSNAAIVAVACAAAGTLLGGPVGAAAATLACAAAAIPVTLTAQNGANSIPFRCLRIKQYLHVIIPSTYTGGYCI